MKPCKASFLASCCQIEYLTVVSYIAKLSILMILHDACLITKINMEVYSCIAIATFFQRCIFRPALCQIRSVAVVSSHSAPCMCLSLHVFPLQCLSSQFLVMHMATSMLCVCACKQVLHTYSTRSTYVAYSI